MIDAEPRPPERKRPLRILWDRLSEPFRIRALLETLTHGSDHARIDAAKRLAALGVRRAVPGLLAMLDSPAWIVRVTAAESLGKLADVRSAPALIDLLGDEDETVARGAMWAVARVAPQITDAVLRADLIERLMALLLDPLASSGTRQTAAWGLTQLARGRGGSDALVPRLIDSLSNSERDVRWIAAFTLKSIGDPRALPGLLALLEDPDRSVQRIAGDAAEAIARQHPGVGQGAQARIDAYRDAVLRRRISVEEDGGPNPLR